MFLLQYLSDESKTSADLFREKLTETRLQFARDPGDSGSVEVQVALLTERIKYLSGHLREHKKDYSSRRGLFGWLSQRKRLLKYLHRTDYDSYQKLIKDLGLKDAFHQQ